MVKQAGLYFCGHKTAPFMARMKSGRSSISWYRKYKIPYHCENYCKLLPEAIFLWYRKVYSRNHCENRTCLSAGKSYREAIFLFEKPRALARGASFLILNAMLLLMPFDYAAAGEAKPDGRAVISAAESDAESADKSIAAVSPEARQRANPFLTPAEEMDTLKEANRFITVENLSLSTIIYASEKSKAIINGRILMKNDKIDNKEIIDIQPEAVILKDAVNEYILNLRKI